MKQNSLPPGTPGANGANTVATQEPGHSTSPTSAERRSGRIGKEIPVLLIGTNADGRVFTEETHTVVVSLHGAGVVSTQRLIAEQELVLRWKETGREADMRVVGEIAEQGRFHTYGMAFVDETLDFRRTRFPPATDGQARPAVLLLECAGCHTVVELLNGDFEYDICAIHGGLTRHCDDCDMLMIWKRSTQLMPSVRPKKKPQPTREKWPPEQPSLAPKKHSSPKKSPSPSSKAAQPEPTVACIDMAKGGVSFRSRNEYATGTMIQISVPFAAEAREAPAIFVSARIMNVRKIPGGDLFRCGVQFNK
jgi:PilZ domain